jgi:putative ABC transport system permease protein
MGKSLKERSSMTAGNLLRTAWLGISTNRLRAALTCLGVIIGVASVIATLALGNGTQEAVEANFHFLGSDQVQIEAKHKLEDGERVPTGKILSYEDGLLMPKALGHVDLVEMTIFSSVKLRYGRNAQSNVPVQGTMSNQLLNFTAKGECQPKGWSAEDPPKPEDFLAFGRFYSPTEVYAGAEVCALGWDLAEELFEGADPLGETVRVNRKTCQVIGVVVEVERTDPSERDFGTPNRMIYMPVSLAVKDLFEEEPSVTITAYLVDETQIEEAKADITSYLRQRHEIHENPEGIFEDDFQLTIKEELVAAQREAAHTFSLLLTALACISLVVGGIGIMNVMLVSVTERMPEIGIRRAVGARRIDVILQFLMEALILSSISGVFGIALGILFIPFAASLHQGLALLDPKSIPLAFGVAQFTGLTFGLYPAIHASRLDPIVALRYE